MYGEALKERNSPTNIASPNSNQAIYHVAHNISLDGSLPHHICIPAEEW